MVPQRQKHLYYYYHTWLLEQLWYFVVVLLLFFWSIMSVLQSSVWALEVDIWKLRYTNFWGHFDHILSDTNYYRGLCLSKNAHLGYFSESFLQYHWETQTAPSTALICTPLFVRLFIEHVIIFDQLKYRHTTFRKIIPIPIENLFPIVVVNIIATWPFKPTHFIYINTSIFSSSEVNKVLSYYDIFVKV